MWRAFGETLLRLHRGDDTVIGLIGLPWVIAAIIGGLGGIFLVDIFSILIPPAFFALALLNVIIKDFLADRRIRHQPGRVGPLSKQEISYARTKLLSAPGTGNAMTRRTR